MQHYKIIVKFGRQAGVFLLLGVLSGKLAMSSSIRVFFFTVVGNLHKTQPTGLVAYHLLFPGCRNHLEGWEKVQKRIEKIEVFFLTAEKNEAALAGGFEIILTPYGIEPNATR